MARKVTESYMTLRTVEEKGDLAEDGETLDNEARIVFEELDQEINYEHFDADVSMQVEQLITEDAPSFNADVEVQFNDCDFSVFLQGIQHNDPDDPWDQSKPNKKKTVRGKNDRLYTESWKYAAEEYLKEQTGFKDHIHTFALHDPIIPVNLRKSKKSYFLLKIIFYFTDC